QGWKSPPKPISRQLCAAAALGTQLTASQVIFSEPWTFAGWGQSLAITLLICSLGSLLLSFSRQTTK
ncbi:hypothetical protein ABN222_19385, partial [Providencia alcalifaciens]